MSPPDEDRFRNLASVSALPPPRRRAGLCRVAPDRRVSLRLRCRAELPASRGIEIATGAVVIWGRRGDPCRRLEGGRTGRAPATRRLVGTFWGSPTQSP